MLMILFTVLFLATVKGKYSGDSCLDRDKPGVCIAQSECQSLLDEVRAAGSPMPMYIRKRLQMLTCGYNIVEPLVCCVPKEGPTITEAPTDRNKRPVDNKQGNTWGSVITGPPDVEDHPNLGLLPSECGSIESNRIWGGNRTALYEMPWMVLLSYTGARTKFNCGGTIINQWHILTAAHCVKFLGRTQKLESVILGEYDVRTDPDCDVVDGVRSCAPNMRIAEIAKIIAHPGYNPNTNLDDIALIRLAEPADFNLDTMKPICLPVTRDLQKEVMDGLNGIVAGWGVTETGLQSPVLLSVDLPIMRNKDCAAYFKGKTEITEKQLCAGGLADKDSCGGDSGGPLMYPGRVGIGGVRYVQRGIVSLGSNRCGVKGFPGVYTRTAYYMDWILDNIRS